MKILLYIPILLILSACQHAVSKTEHVKATAKVVLPPDSMLLTKPGAVIVMPSSRMINKMKKELPGDGDYDTVLDDNVWYMDQSKHYLDSVKCSKIQRESEGVMRFKTLAGKTYTVKLDSAFFDIILFNGKDKPIQASLTDFQQDYEEYMKK
jgi:hypothetical protein